MRFLISEIALLLVLAFALGVVVGALLGRVERRPPEPTALEVEVAGLRQQLRQVDGGSGDVPDRADEAPARRDDDPR